MSLVVDLTIPCSKFITLAIRDSKVVPKLFAKVVLLSSPSLSGQMRKQKSEKINSSAHVHMVPYFQSKDHILGIFDWLLSNFFLIGLGIDCCVCVTFITRLNLM